MEKGIPSEIFDMLQTPLQKAGKRAPVTPKRQINIEWVQNLPRTDLSYQRKEKQVLIYPTCAGEKVFIQYPGKESVREKNPRLWDFRPEFYFADNKRHKNMSFGDIWDIIEKIVDKPLKDGEKEIIHIIATLLYRMAFMLDHIKVEPFSTLTRDVIYKGNNELEYSDERTQEFPAIFKYQPKEQILNHITKRYPQWGEMSFEAFLFYYELLVCNEDCKYYYRNHQDRINKQKKTVKWINNTGRVNTLLTSLRILGYCSGVGNISLSGLLNDFSYGVSPASDEEIIRLCGGLVTSV